MPIICEICGREFLKQINNRHLKFAHNISTLEYKALYGSKSLSSSEYRLEKSKANCGSNNNMFGKLQSEETKNLISAKNKGKTPHNKGKKITSDIQIENLRTAINKREQNYRTINLL